MFFPLMMAEFGNQTVLDFGIVQERALKHNARRTGRKAAGLSHHKWCFYCFCLHHINFRKLNSFTVAKVHHYILFLQGFRVSLLRCCCTSHVSHVKNNVPPSSRSARGGRWAPRGIPRGNSGVAGHHVSVGGYFCQ